MVSFELPNFNQSDIIMKYKILFIIITLIITLIISLSGFLPPSKHTRLYIFTKYTFPFIKEKLEQYIKDNQGQFPSSWDEFLKIYGRNETPIELLDPYTGFKSKFNMLL